MADTTASSSTATTVDDTKPTGLRLSPKRLEQIMPWAVVIGLFLFWEGAVWVFDLPEFLLPAPSVIFEAMWQWRVPILDNAAQTAMTTVVGFGIAIVFGLVTGILIGSSSLIYNGFYPVLIGFNSIPKVAVVPILVIWFGIGTVPAIITAFLISFFPILVNVATGIATVEPELKDVLRALGASKRDIIVKVGIPRSLPYFFASLKIAITVAFVGSIIAETVASNKGIGHLMIVASSRFEVPLVFAGLLVTAIMGVMMYAVAIVVEKRMTGWSTRSMDGASAGL
jgi:NitT/TauT family transport system permease protein